MKLIRILFFIVGKKINLSELMILIFLKFIKRFFFLWRKWGSILGYRD